MSKLWEGSDVNRNLTCNICKKTKERRVLSPFYAYKPKENDWVADIVLPDYNDGTYGIRHIDVCGDCYQKVVEKLSEIIKPVAKRRKKNTPKSQEKQMAFEF